MAGPPVPGLSLQDVVRARARLAGKVVRSPLVPSPVLARRRGIPVYLKLENQQLTGSFKLRGALNAVLALTDEERARGVVTVSTGNHGRAVAHACRLTNTRAVVFMSSLVPANKVTAIEELGAEIHISGRSQDEAQREAERLVASEGLNLIPPFDHPAVIAGQGTLGLEIAEQLAEEQLPGEEAPASVLVPLSGGGLVAGVALALKSIDPSIRIVAVGMSRGCAMHASIAAGEPVEVEEFESLADSLGGGIGADNRYTLALVRELVDEIVLVDEEEVAGAIVHAYREERQVVEGAGAVGMAALLAGVADPAGRPAVVVVSGANIDMELHGRLVRESAEGSWAGTEMRSAGGATVKAGAEMVNEGGSD